MQQARVEAMSNEMISVPRDWAQHYADLLEECCAYEKSEQVSALLAQPVDSQHRKDDQAFNAARLLARAAIVLGLEPDNTSWFEVVGEMEKAVKPQGEPVAWRVQRITPTGYHRLDRPLLTLATPEEWGPAWKAEPLYTRPAEQWQPIETAPKDGTEIILRKGDRITAGAWIEWSNSAAEFHATTGVYLGDVEYESGADWSSWDGGFRRDDWPTHWQPLPIPPQQ